MLIMGTGFPLQWLTLSGGIPLAESR